MSPDRRQRIFALSLPIIGGMISQNLFNVVDTAMVGLLGNAALAAVGLGGFIVFACQSVVLGISTGVQSVAARRRGAGELDRPIKILNSALLIVLAIAPLLSLLLTQFVEPVYPYINGDADVIEQGVPYLQIRLAAIVFVGMNFAFRGYWNAIDMSRIYMSTLIATHLCNILLNYVLIFGKFGAPALGVSGAGYASAVSLAFGTGVYFLLSLRLTASRGFLRGLANRDEVSALIRIALPSSLQQVFFAAGMVTMFWIVGMIGTPEVAVANVLITVTLFALLPGLGLGIACTTLVGQALGAGDADDAHRWGWDVTRVAIALMSTLALPMVLAPDFVSSLFLHDTATQALARWPMRLVGMLMPIEAIGFVLMHALLGAGDARRVMLVSIVVQWLLFLPLAWVIGPMLGYGLLGVWLWQGITRAGQAAVFLGSWQSRQWQHVEV
ncbi:MAG: MATE family efflux transporter [Pseudomonadota bacterium]